MSGIPVITDGGSLTAENGYTIPNPAVAPFDVGFSGLWLPTLTGSNREVVDGHVSVPSRIKQQSVDVPLVVVPEVDADGNPQTSGPAGLWANIDDLAAAWLDPSLVGDGAQDVTFVPYSGGPTLVGRAKCTGITIGEPQPSLWKVALHLVLPDGPLQDGS